MSRTLRAATKTNTVNEADCLAIVLSLRSQVQVQILQKPSEDAQGKLLAQGLGVFKRLGALRPM